MKPLHLLLFATAVGLGAFFPTPASAHLVNTNVGEFYAGMLHPLTSAEHLLPTLALALLAIQCGTHAARTTLFVFPMALLAGTLAGAGCLPSPSSMLRTGCARGIGRAARPGRPPQRYPAGGGRGAGAADRLDPRVPQWHGHGRLAGGCPVHSWGGAHGAHRRGTGRVLGPGGLLALRPHAPNTGRGRLRGGWHGAAEPAPDRRRAPRCPGGQAAGAGGSAGHAPGG